ncbi:hypothetical protein [Streptomyces griseoviridis]|uniref:Deoxyxylulose-5-phosphate synthase n=1 Tax=Streptomyces griseoviridis TaxID=45398 RepID=A0ABT9LF44_STRGD|nr:hypothetical protein [Streptomyces griseoviridis]MDP9682349.1 hypothetical protein [Streptomyces griseoviridis]GGS82115.1 hypothetical protein GCM10010240_14370 [Streptomyces griseoviridis]
MSEPTHEQPTTDSPPADPVRFCGWCRRYRTGTALISMQDSATIPSAPTLYACGPCRETRGLVPLADREPQP